MRGAGRSGDTTPPVRCRAVAGRVLLGGGLCAPVVGEDGAPEQGMGSAKHIGGSRNLRLNLVQSGTSRPSCEAD